MSAFVNDIDNIIFNLIPFNTQLLLTTTSKYYSTFTNSTIHGLHLWKKNTTLNFKFNNVCISKITNHIKTVLFYNILANSNVDFIKYFFDAFKFTNADLFNYPKLNLLLYNKDINVIKWIIELFNLDYYNITNNPHTYPYGYTNFTAKIDNFYKIIIEDLDIESFISLFNSHQLIDTVLRNQLIHSNIILKYDTFTKKNNQRTDINKTVYNIVQKIIFIHTVDSDYFSENFIMTLYFKLLDNTDDDSYILNSFIDHFHDLIDYYLINNTDHINMVFYNAIKYNNMAQCKKLYEQYSDNIDLLYNNKANYFNALGELRDWLITL